MYDALLSLAIDLSLPPLLRKISGNTSSYASFLI